MSETLPKVLLTFRIGGENGGPYVSHKRILESDLRKKYDIKPLFIENPRKMRNPKIFLSTVRRIKAEKPDIVHLAGLGTEGFLMMLACRLARVKTVVAIRGSATEAIGFNRFENFIFRLIEGYTVRKADMVYGVSDYVSSWRICKKAKKYFGTIYNIPSFSYADTGEQCFRSGLCIKPDDVVVASTGRITKDKGFDTLSQIIITLKDYDNIKFVIAGDGNFKDDMKKELLMAGAKKNTYFLGYQKDVDSILKESDIFIICTKHETLCNSLLEAGADSLPLIASNVGGIPEIIKHGENGFLVEPHDVNGFCKAILLLAEDKDKREAMGVSAKNTIDSKFSADQILPKLNQIYQMVLKK